MPTGPANVRRHFIPWDRPLLAQVAAWLAQGWAGAGPLDLSDVLVIVPTRQSGRRLREALAEHALTRAAAVFPPRVLTPDALLAQAVAIPGIASGLESLLAWTEVFLAIDTGQFRSVFPVDPPGRTFPWALRLGQQFLRLQDTLAENGLRLADVADRAGADFVEGSRWRGIAELELRHAASLAARRLRDPHEARIDLAAGARGGWEGFKRIIVAAVPDPQPLALAALGSIAGARGLPIDVIVFAPADESDAFDEWGRPLPAGWEQREIGIDAFETRVHLCADPAAQAAGVAGLAASYPAPDGIMGVGIADPEVGPLLENELMRVGRPCFNPDGSPFRNEALYQLLASLSALAVVRSFAAVEALARCPDFCAFLGARAGARFSVARWLDGLDELRARHLPADLEAARDYAPRLEGHPEVVAGLAEMARVCDLLGADDFARGVTEALRAIFGARQFDSAQETEGQLQAAAAIWMDILRECATAGSRFGTLATPDWWELALRWFGDQRRTEEKPAGALELQGWLELLWEDAPHLVVAGMNDGRVPEAVVEDAFLPEGLRRILGLKSNAARYARDAYLLQAVAACRRQGGRVDLLFGKASAAGDPLRPSRLLLRCADVELPHRISHLFRPLDPATAGASWRRAWKLTPRSAPPPGKVAVTSLRAYLECPFRFHLRTVLGMESVDPFKNELDALDFGTLCHTVLEHIGRDAILRDCTNPAELRDAVVKHLDRVVRARYGGSLTLPLLVQVESARQRIAKLAELQAGERAAGWEIVQVERPFEVEISGLLVRGKIDRVDRHAATGAVRVLDYKTSDAPVTPAEAHLRPLRDAETVPDWVRLDIGGKPRAWSDLQLPLYLCALAREFPGRLACGYFNLPRAAGGTALAVWDDYTPELHEAAMRCAGGVCGAIRAGEFWPPNETLRSGRDDFAELFHHGIRESVEWQTQ